MAKKPQKSSSLAEVALPQPFLERMQLLLGGEYQSFMDSLALPAFAGLRVNTLKLSPESFLQKKQFDLAPVAWCPAGFLVDTHGDKVIQTTPGKHPYHAAGLYYLQEPSAMAAALILAPQPGESVLDLSAAPGGKATHLAALMGNTGFLVANEIHPKRVWDLAENLERCGVTNAILTNDTPGKLAVTFPEFFDRVLLDAPCSGEGMFRKSPIARTEWKPSLVHSCAIRQIAILNEAAKMVKPGGYLAYTTCTFSPDENEDVLVNFLAHHPDFELSEVQAAPGFQPARPEWVGLPADHTLRHAVRLWPHHAPAEGHFIALLNKHGSAVIHPGMSQGCSRDHPSRPPRHKKVSSAWPAWHDFYQANLNIELDESTLILDGSYLYRVPENAPGFSGVKVIKPGLWLGSISKDRFIPSHSLAMSLKSEQAQRLLDLAVNDRRLTTYLAGESISEPGEDGWILVTVEGFPIGWGKRVQNVVKNFYPHGLRRQV
ncbi:MAG: SAM-dependent methyltransferase [Anaerolineales bacterium]|nr:MAG: SAM-dependent methyltransferase [Anaerolineales bacterium]